MAELHDRGDRPEPEEPDEGGGADRPRFEAGEPPDWNAPRWQDAKFELAADDDAELSEAAALSPRQQCGIEPVRRDEDSGEDEGAEPTSTGEPGEHYRTTPDTGGEPEPETDAPAESPSKEPETLGEPFAESDEAAPDEASVSEVEAPDDAGDIGAAEQHLDRRLAVDGRYINAYLDPDAAAAREAGTRTPDPLPEERLGERIAEKDTTKKSRKEQMRSFGIEHGDSLETVGNATADAAHLDPKLPSGSGPGLYGRTGQVPGPAIHDHPAPAVQTNSVVSMSLAVVATGLGVWSLVSRWLHGRHHRGNN